MSTEHIDRQIIIRINMHYLIIGIGVNWENAPLETSDYVKKFLRIDKNDFIFHAMMNVDEKVGNSQLYFDRIATI